MAEGIPQQREAAENQEILLAERLAYWQSQVAQISSSVPSTQSIELRRQATEELDELWMHHQVACAYRGWGLRISFDDEGLPVEEKDYFEGLERSCGFEIMKFGADEAGVWRICYGFLEPVPNTARSQIKSFVYLDAENAQISPVSTDEELFLPVLQQESQSKLHEMLNQSSDQMVSILSDSKFFQLSGLEQYEKIDKFLREITRRAEGLGGLRNRPLVAEAEYGYTYVKNGRNFPLARQVDLSDLVVKGECKGLYVLGMEKLRHKALSGIDDLVDSASGLSLVVRIDEVTRREIGLNDNMLYLPISGQELQASFQSLQSASGES